VINVERNVSHPPTSNRRLCILKKGLAREDSTSPLHDQPFWLWKGKIDKKNAVKTNKVLNTLAFGCGVKTNQISGLSSHYLVRHWDFGDLTIE